MQQDILNRYIFDEMHVRGELVQLNKTYQQILENHEYPKGVQALIGELLAATCLLTATLKLEGEIAVQIQGDGPVGYISVNGNNNQEMRAIARMREETNATGLKDLIGKGNMVITIRPNVGEPYQGVVALEKDNLADCLSHYFEVSEQIPTKLWLFIDTETKQAAGKLIQLLPDGDDKAKQHADYEHLYQITNTLKQEEALSLDAEDLLYRLYHQEKVRLFEPQAVTYKCSCSEEKCLNAIAQIEPSELKSILAEQGNVSITCDYCATTYSFDENGLAQFLDDTRH